MSKYALLGGTAMITQDTLLMRLIQLIDRTPAPPTRRLRGRPIVYSDRLLLKSIADHDRSSAA